MALYVCDSLQGKRTKTLSAKKLIFCKCLLDMAHRSHATEVSPHHWFVRKAALPQTTAPQLATLSEMCEIWLQCRGRSSAGRRFLIATHAAFASSPSPQMGPIQRQRVVKKKKHMAAKLKMPQFTSAHWTEHCNIILRSVTSLMGSERSYLHNRQLHPQNHIWALTQARLQDNNDSRGWLRHTPLAPAPLVTA